MKSTSRGDLLVGELLARAQVVVVEELFPPEAALAAQAGALGRGRRDTCRRAAGTMTSGRLGRAEDSGDGLLRGGGRDRRLGLEPRTHRRQADLERRRLLGDEVLDGDLGTRVGASLAVRRLVAGRALLERSRRAVRPASVRRRRSAPLRPPARWARLPRGGGGGGIGVGFTGSMSFGLDATRARTPTAMGRVDLDGRGARPSSMGMSSSEASLRSRSRPSSTDGSSATVGWNGVQLSSWAGARAAADGAVGAGGGAGSGGGAGAAVRPG